MNPINIDELLKILPTLIRENDTIKGAIITALSGVVATKEDIKELIQQMDKRFEALQQQMDKRFEAMDKRFEALQQQMDKRFEAMDKRFDRLEGALTEIRLVLGRPFEQFARNVVTRILQAEGFQRIDLRSIKLEDPKRTVSSATTEVEIDGLSLDPPVIIEITSILKEHSKIDNFLRKKAFVESLYHKKFRGFLVAASTQLSAEEIATITIELRKNNAELINL